MTQKEKYVTCIEGLWKTGLLYFIIGGFISADNYLPENKVASLDLLTKFNKYLKYTNIEENKKKNIKKYLLDGIKILKNELKKDGTNSIRNTV